MTELARDVRFGGSWTRAQTLKNDVLYALITATLAGGARVPRGALRALGRGAGALACALAGGLARDNVRRALGVTQREAARVARASYQNLGAHLADLVAALGGAPLEHLPISSEALATIDQARARGRGVLFVSAHLGPWERVAATLVARGVPLVTVARESYDPRLNRLYDAIRSRAGVRQIYRGDPRAPLQIVRALREGAVLGLPMDLRTRAASVMVPFFGRLAATVVGPARLALRTRAPLVVGTIEGGLRITTTALETDEDEARMTARLNAELERRVRSVPEEWLWMHPRW